MKDYETPQDFYNFEDKLNLEQTDAQNDVEGFNQNLLSEITQSDVPEPK